MVSRDHDQTADIALEGWEPIDTAPTDGTKVRIRFFRPYVWDAGEGHQDWETVGYHAARPAPFCRTYWRALSGQGFQWGPTHWRPR